MTEECRHYSSQTVHDGMGWTVKCLECDLQIKHFSTKARAESEWQKTTGKARK